jgi:hypothetical protein
MPGYATFVGDNSIVLLKNPLSNIIIYVRYILILKLR